MPSHWLRVLRRAVGLPERRAPGLEALLETTPNWIAVAVEGRIAYANDSSRRLLGEARRRDLLGRELLDFVHPDDRESARAMLASAERSGESLPSFDVRLRARDDSIVHLEAWVAPIRFRRRSALLIHGRDQSERRRTEAELRESEERFHSLARAVPVGLYRIDHRGRHVFLNERWSDITGIPIESGIGVIASKWLHADDARQILELSRKALAEGKPLRLEQRVVRPDGDVRWVLNQALPEFDADGAFAGWVGTLTDLSDKRASEQALAESEERLRLALEAADMCTWEWDSPRGRVSWSANAARLFGLAPHESMPTTTADVLKLVHPEDAQAARIFAAEQTRKGESFELEFRIAPRPDGQTRWLLMRGHTSPVKPGCAIGVLAEVTLRRRLAEERSALEERLRESQRLESLGLLAGGVAHDFNNLLVGILGNADLALQRPLGDPGLRECLAEIQRAGERAAGLVRQILAFSGRERIEREPVDLCALVDDTLGLLRSARPGRARIAWRAPDPALHVEGDATQLRQVLMNLVTNACEALPAEGGDVEIRLTPGLATDGPDCVALEVRDSGCGIDAKALAKVFDPFFTTKGAGRGLGLAVAHGIVRAHGGTLLVDSQAGRGTRMRVVLPGTAQRPAPAPERVSGADGATRIARGTVLVVDDERAVREVARRALEAAGYRVLLADGRQQALDQLQRNAGTISAILLDLTLASESGEHVFSALRELAPGTPVLATSGYAAEEALSRLESSGLAGFVQKPFTVARLAQSIDEVIRRAAS